MGQKQSKEGGTKSKDKQLGEVEKLDDEFYKLIRQQKKEQTDKHIKNSTAKGTVFSKVQ